MEDMSAFKDWTEEDWANLDKEGPEPTNSTSDPFDINQLDSNDIQGLVRHTARWCSYLLFNLGIARGMATTGESYPARHFQPKLSECYFHWFYYYGGLHVGFSAADQWHNFRGDERNIQIFPNNTYSRHDNGEALILNCVAVEQTIGLLFESVPFTNRMTFCETGHYEESHGKEQRIADICTSTGGHWVCNNCVDRFALAESIPVLAPDEHDPRKIERAKMIPSLRYAILLRDRFTCKGCGRSPNKGDEIKLHVDHVVAIALGGKTIPENLQALCDECNLGKGISPWLDDPQTSMF